MKKSFKALSVILSLVLLLQVLLPGAAAEDITENIPIEAQESLQILEEDVSKRGEYEKHFLLSDGSYLAVSYADPVHRLSLDGSFEEIDNTLSLKGGRLANADGEFYVSFAEESEKNLVQLSHEGYTVSWGLSSFIGRSVEPADDAVQPVPSVEITEEETEIAVEPDEATEFKTNDEALVETPEFEASDEIIEETTVAELTEAVDETAVTELAD